MARRFTGRPALMLFGDGELTVTSAPVPLWYGSGLELVETQRCARTSRCCCSRRPVGGWPRLSWTNVTGASRDGAPARGRARRARSRSVRPNSVGCRAAAGRDTSRLLRPREAPTRAEALVQARLRPPVPVLWAPVQCRPRAPAAIRMHPAACPARRGPAVQQRLAIGAPSESHARSALGIRTRPSQSRPPSPNPATASDTATAGSSGITRRPAHAPAAAPTRPSTTTTISQRRLPPLLVRPLTTARAYGSRQRGRAHCRTAASPLVPAWRRG